MTLAVDITNGHGLSKEAHHEFLPKKSKIMPVYFTAKGILTSCTLLTRWSASVLKVGMPYGRL